MTIRCRQLKKKHKNLIAKLFKKAGMLEEGGIVLPCDEYKHEIANAMREGCYKGKCSASVKPDSN